MSDKINAILVIGPAWVGDMVMAQSLLRQLRADHPDAAIDVLAPGWTKPLLERMPEVRQGLEMPFGHGQFKPLARVKLGRQMQGQYDWAIVMPYTWKAALLPWGAKIKKRTGFVGEQRWGLLNDIRKLDKAAMPMMTQRYVALGYPKDVFPTREQLPLPKLHTTAQTQAEAAHHAGVHKTERPVMAFCPGAEYGPAKRWPTNYFAEVGKHFVEKGWDIWILGGPKDAALGEEIIQGVGEHCHNLCGKTRLADAIDLLAVADIAVCNDSGLMHIAAAVDTPIVAVFGSSTPDYTPPLSPNAEIVSLNLDCSPCFKKECPFGHYDCLKKLESGRVIQSIENKLRN